MKSPNRRSRRQDAPFEKHEEIWIIRNSGNKSMTQVRREFIIHFKKMNKKKVPSRLAFARLVGHFDVTGSVMASTKEPIPWVRTPENIEKVSKFFEEDFHRSIRQAMRELDLPFKTIWNILRIDLKWKPYRFKRVQKLSPANKEARVDFATWVLA